MGAEERASCRSSADGEREIGCRENVAFCRGLSWDTQAILKIKASKPNALNTCLAKGLRVDSAPKLIAMRLSDATLLTIMECGK
jgi:hypothetical protein